MLIDSLVAEFGDTLVVVCYHDRGAYMNDDAIARLAFYNTGLTKPYVIFDGSEVAWEQIPANYDSVYHEFFRIVRTIAPYFNLETDSVFSDSTTAGFMLWVVPTDTLPSNTINTFIIVLEDSLLGNYTTHVNVCRDIMQFPVDMVYGDTLDTNIVFNHNIPTGRLKAAVFVQNMDTKEVMQARMVRF
ncbi:hypothetical protein A2Y85_01740 [candidate division WOR-3 bacterium RBG_13_43_14]|uniref:Uncharacterized protein n=1 Tax=candidate division WOR-3 bacterium RBG_13_43_14 TaxID=1802590 RepID=A0A1F4U1T3_UNCW3|nr:MAG: hypothetical protein A2Y85_01740 [candidate division WOR-3 bacterium RBG_13_43_14]